MLIKSFFNHFAFHKISYFPLRQFNLTIAQKTFIGNYVQVQPQIPPVDVHHICDNPGARPKKLRVGRGMGSGIGKTSGRGHKGQFARKGSSLHPKFEGGQSPMSRRYPKRGFNAKKWKEPLDCVNISKILYYIEKGKIDPDKPITIKELLYAGAVSNVKYGVRILGKGAEKLKDYGKPLNFEVTDASQVVIDTVKESGGSITSFYRNQLTLRSYLKPHKFSKELKIPMPDQDHVMRLEKLKEKGMNVIYPEAPWFEVHKEKLKEEQENKEKEKKAPLYPQSIPVSKEKGVGINRPRIEKKELSRRTSFPL